MRLPLPQSAWKPLSVLGAVFWKTLALALALIVGGIAAESVGWNGGAWLFGKQDTDTDGLGGFLNQTIMTVGVIGSAGVFYFVSRIARWALWGFIPIMAYAGLVLGMWDGLASGFDATRVEVIRHKYANAYALRHMSSSAFEATCYDSRINLTADAKALCGAKRAARGFRQ